MGRSEDGLARREDSKSATTPSTACRGGRIPRWREVLTLPAGYAFSSHERLPRRPEAVRERSAPCPLCAADVPAWQLGDHKRW